MPTRVLAFESDPDFSRELSTQFRALGCEVTVVDDVNLGLQAASVSKPDLILLTIELPRMSGYSVCNRIKRDAELKDIPLIILSSESTDQTFEQHRRLGTRAQDYVRKPVTFAKLIEHVRNFVSLGAAPLSVSPEDDGIVIDDEIELTEDALISAPPAAGSMSPSMRPIDADIDDFAEHAFGAMIEPPTSTQPSHRPSSGVMSSAIPSSPRLPSDLTSPSLVSDGSELARAEDESRKLKAQLEDKERLLAEAQGELKELRRSSRSAQNDSAELETLRRELQELKSKQGASLKPSGPSAREFLDLREQLNKKDKELLDQRDQISHKDKELLNLRDSSLALDREKADLSDKADDQARQLTELQKIADAAKNDKEAAAKRAEDHKRKSEKLAGQLEEKTAELEKVNAKHSAEIKERDAERERLVSEHATALDSARNEFVRTLNETEDEARAALEKALTEAIEQAERHEQQALEAERQKFAEQHASGLSELEHKLRAELGAEKSAEIDRLQSSSAVEIGRLQSENAAEIDRLQSSSAAEIDRLRSEKASSEQERDRQIEELKAQAESLREELNQARYTLSERDQSLGNLDANLHSVRGDLEQAHRAVEERESRIQTLESELAKQRSDMTSTLEVLSAERHRLAAAHDKLAAAHDKWNEDQAGLERLKDALAAALVQVEAIEQRTIE